ncbi:MAG: NAD(P)-dependent dehydrogenase (short-subunit alcohol dehydrogenase family), partial [Acidimicrobiales bacterium]
MYRLDLQDKSAVVTGGASGIGEAAARQLAALGAKVCIADLNEELGQKVATEVGGIFVKCDVRSEEDGKAVVLAASEMGPLRALVNSAGMGMAGRTIDRNNEPMDLAIFQRVI